MSHPKGHVRSSGMLVILAGWIFCCPAAAEVISVSVPFVAPQGDYVTQQDRYYRFRIPGMMVAPDGSVLLFAEARRGEGSDPRRDKNAPIDLVMRRSTDHGRTWQPMVVIDSGFRPNGDLVDFADPDAGTRRNDRDGFLVLRAMARHGAPDRGVWPKHQPR